MGTKLKNYFFSDIDSEWLFWWNTAADRKGLCHSVGENNVHSSFSPESEDDLRTHEFTDLCKCPRSKHKAVFTV